MAKKTAKSAAARTKKAATKKSLINTETIVNFGEALNINFGLIDKWLKRLEAKKERIHGMMHVKILEGKKKGQHCFCAMGDLVDLYDPDGWQEEDAIDDLDFATKDNPNGRVLTYSYEGYDQSLEEETLRKMGLSSGF